MRSSCGGKSCDISETDSLESKPTFKKIIDTIFTTKKTNLSIIRKKLFLAITKIFVCNGPSSSFQLNYLGAIK
jgi:hypothetical protein